MFPAIVDVFHVEYSVRAPRTHDGFGEIETKQLQVMFIGHEQRKINVIFLKIENMTSHCIKFQMQMSPEILEKELLMPA